MAYWKYIAALALFVNGVSAAAGTLDFEEFVPSPTGNPCCATLNTQGYRITDDGAGHLTIVDDTRDANTNSGSNQLLAEFNFFTMTLPDPENPGFFLPFDLHSFRGGEGRNIDSGFFQYSATSIQVEGTLAAGGTVSRTFTLDLIADNTEDDFELFIFSAGFTGLSSVTFSGLGGQAGNRFGVDDLVVTQTVPIPAAAWLFGSGLGLLGWMRRRVQS